jgi:hypothetical protein
LSVRVMSWVWDHGPSEPTERLVLLALADFCDDGGHCWPSVATIGRKCAMTERGARGVLRRLEAGGWLSTSVGGGRGGSSRYAVLMQNPERKTGNVVPGIEQNPERDDTKTRNVATLNPEPRSAEPSRTIIREEKNPPTPQGGKCAEFERVWPHYPRRVGKAAAQRAWLKARKRAGYDEIAEPLKACIRAWRNTPPDKIPHFATWLNRDGWLDDPGHASNRARTGREDVESLSRITAADDVASLFADIPLRIVK